MIWGSQANPGEPDYFQFDLIRKYVIVFGQLFNDITIQKQLANNTTQVINVPIEYMEKEKMVARLLSDPDIDRPFSVLVPRITFEIAPNGILPDFERNLPTLNKNVVINTTDKNKLTIQYAATAYKMMFEARVYVKNALDGIRIVEQIFSFFRPDYTRRVILIPEMNETRDIPILIKGVQYQDYYDEKFTTRRVIEYTLTFEMKVWFFGPIRNKPPIKFITINQRIGYPYNSENAATGAQGQINAAVNSSVNTIVLTSANGLPNTGTYYARIDNELVYVANGVGTTILTVQRGQTPSQANAHKANTEFVVVFDPGIAEYVTAQPGLDANGNPTNFANDSVGYQNISITDDYGFIQQTNSGQVT